MNATDILQRIQDESPGVEMADLIAVTQREHDYLMTRKWKFTQKTYDFQTTAPYSTGTVDLTNGDATVSGTGTTFVAGMATRKFREEGSSVTYVYTTHTSGTEFELDRAFTGDTDTGLSYSIFEDEYSLPSDYGSMYKDGLFDLDNQRRLRLIDNQRWLQHSFSGGVAEQDAYLFTIFDKDSSDNPKIRLVNAPTAQTNLRLFYWRKETVITTPFTVIDIPDYLESALWMAVRLEYMYRRKGGLDPILIGRAERQLRKATRAAVNADARLADPYMINARVVL